MRTNVIRVTVFALSLGAAAAAQAQVCVRIDESHDTLSQDDRTAAVLLLNRQFASAGEQVVADCAVPYMLAHIKLGNTITVTLSGPKGSREGTALGLDDLPALYSQMVRSLETGHPMTGLGVVDRTNVTAAQATAQRVHSDGFFYARLGYGGIFGGRTYGVPSFGLGYRAEIDKVAIDVSFLNFQISNSDYSYAAGSADSASLLKLSGLYMVHRDANSTPYFGGGLSWGHTSVYESRPVTVAPGTPSATAYTYTTGGDGSGLQGELTAGYEFARATTIRMFVQADAVLPFYSVTTQTFVERRPVGLDRPLDAVTDDDDRPRLPTGSKVSAAARRFLVQWRQAALDASSWSHDED
jgi:hypothetical protein